MRKLTPEDIYLLSEIVDKMNVTLPDMPNIKGKSKEEIDLLQRRYGLDIITTLFTKIHRAKNEINTLIESVTDKKVKDMSLKELKDTFTEIFQQEGILDFFK
jgi:predicted metal-dependent hydrolase